LFSTSLQAVERFEFPDRAVEVSGRPLEASLSRLVQAYCDHKKSTMNDLDKSLFQDYELDRDRILNHILEESLVSDFVSFLQKADPVSLQALREISHLLVSRLRFSAHGVNQDSGLASQILELIPSASLSATYEYAYGRELERKAIKEYEVIHRNTFFENREHRIDIDVDFLGPLKKVLKALKVEKSFSWVWKQKLRFAYKAWFKHYKKVFARTLGFYEKVSVKIEILRRKRSFWGTGEWESHGHTYITREEPRALLTTEAREL
jgi:hypothetical protein